MQRCQPYEPNARESGDLTHSFRIEIYSRFSRSLFFFIFVTAVNVDSDRGTAITHLIETNAIVIEETTQCLTM